MNAPFIRARSLALATLVSTCAATAAHAAKSGDPNEPADAIHELDKMIISEKADGVVPLMACWQCTLAGRLIIAPTVPPATRPGESFSLTIQSHPNSLKFRGPRFDTTTLRGTPEDYGFSGGSNWKKQNSAGFPPELCLPGGGQIVAIDGQDVWETNGYTLRKLFFGGRVGDPVTLVIQGANDDRFVFREITLKRISFKKWADLLKTDVPPYGAREL